MTSSFFLLVCDISLWKRLQWTAGLLSQMAEMFRTKRTIYCKVSRVGQHEEHALSEDVQGNGRVFQAEGGWKSHLIHRGNDGQICLVWNDGQTSTVCRQTKVWTVCLRGSVPFPLWLTVVVANRSVSSGILWPVTLISWAILKPRNPVLPFLFAFQL